MSLIKNLDGEYIDFEVLEVLKDPKHEHYHLAVYNYNEMLIENSILKIVQIELVNQINEQKKHIDYLKLKNFEMRRILILDEPDLGMQIL